MTTEDLANSMTFDEASQKTAEMFEQPVEQQQTTIQQPTEEVQQTQVQQPQVQQQVEPVISQDVLQMQQQMAEIARQNEELKAMLQQQSQQQQEVVVEEALEMPTIDLTALAYEDEDTIRQKQKEYSEQLTEYNRKLFLKEIEPVLQQAQKQSAIAQKQDVINNLSSVPELSGIAEMLPQLDKIIANNRALSSADIPLDEKYVTAFLMAKGVNTLNSNPKELSVEEKLAMLEQDKELQDLYEKKRIEKVKGGQQVPSFSASSGAVNAALNIKEKPKTFEEASELTRMMFGN